MADIDVQTRSGFGLGAVMARKDVQSMAIGDALKIDAPIRPAIMRGADGLALIGTGAGTWLAYVDTLPPSWIEGLRSRLTGLASVSDQSDGYAITRLVGADARTVLQRGVAIDLHPGAFLPGSAATTVIAHIGVILWRIDDDPVRGPVFDIATFRSFSDSFRHWLDLTVAALR